MAASETGAMAAKLAIVLVDFAHVPFAEYAVFVALLWLGRRRQFEDRILVVVVYEFAADFYLLDHHDWFFDLRRCLFCLRFRELIGFLTPFIHIIDDLFSLFLIKTARAFRFLIHLNLGQVYTLFFFLFS